jgi:hypothetical protein
MQLYTIFLLFNHISYNIYRPAAPIIAAPQTGALVIIAAPPAEVPELAALDFAPDAADDKADFAEEAAEFTATLKLLTSLCRLVFAAPVAVEAIDSRLERPAEASERAEERTDAPALVAV